MKNTLAILFLILVSNFTFAQISEENMVLKIDYDESFDIEKAQAHYIYNGAGLVQDRDSTSRSACAIEVDKQTIIFDSIPCFDSELTISFWLKLGNNEEDARFPIFMLTNKDDFYAFDRRSIGFNYSYDRIAYSYYKKNSGKLVKDDEFIVNDQEWHHVIGVLSDLSIFKLYIDNELISHFQWEDIDISNLDRIWLGGEYYSPSMYGNYKIDDVRLYNRNITRCEIEALFYEKKQVVDCGEIEEISCNYVSTNDINEINTFSIYPNPTSEYIIMSSTMEKYEIYNAVGLLESKGIIDKHKINVVDLNPGIYFIRTKHGVEKFIKNRY